MGTRIIVDLSQKVGTFTADTTRYVRTHIKAVDGLLDGSNLINLALLPPSVKYGLRLVGSVSLAVGMDGLDDIWVDKYNNGIGAEPGQYVNIAVGGTFGVPEGYEIANGDDGGGTVVGGAAVGITLEKNDWLVFRGFNASTKIFDVINHNYPEATASTAGLMSGADKNKLNSIAANANNYVHPSYTATSKNLSDIYTIDEITIENGHISAITTQAIATASVSQQGLVELLSQNEARSSTLDTSRAATHSTVRDIMKYFEQIPVYSSGADAAANLALANGSDAHGEGAFVFIKSGEVTI